MYLTVGVVMAMILVLLSPAIWAAWWLVADLGQRGSESASTGQARRDTWRVA
jgi:hypothetical protein